MAKIVARKSCGEVRRIVMKHLTESPGATVQIIASAEGVNVQRIIRAIRQLKIWGKIPDA